MVVVVGAAMAPMSANAATPPPPVFLKTLAGPGAANVYSGGLAYDAVNNRLVTADTGLDKVEFYSLAGIKLGEFGSYGAGPGHFNEPRDIAIDPSANIYVADSVNNRVQKFDSTGKWLGMVGTISTLPNPLGLSWDFQNNVLLVVSTPTNAVEAFDAGLNIKWKTPTQGVGLLNPRDATRGPDGRIWVADYSHERIKAFDVSSSGAWSTSPAIVLGGNGTGLGQLNSPYNVDFSPDGKTAYVADTGNERVARWGLTASGWSPLSPAFGSRCTTMPCGPGQIEGLRRVVVVPNGTVYADDLWGNGIDYFAPNSNGTALGEIEGAPPPAKGFAQAFGVAVASDGTAYGVDRINQRIERFDSGGNFLNSSGVRGTGPADESWPESVAVTPDGRVWVADTRNNRLQVWPADLCKSSPTSCPVTIVGAGQLFYPRGVASDPAGNVWVADTRHDRIVRCTVSTNCSFPIGSTGSGPGQFKRPTGLAVSSSAIYVADTGNMRIEELGLDGHYINSYTAGLGGIQDIAIAPDGTLWVADSGHSRIVHVSADLAITYPDTFGSPDPPVGSPAPSQFFQPHSLAIHGTTLFVADTFNNRIQEFTITPVT